MELHQPTEMSPEEKDAWLAISSIIAEMGPTDSVRQLWAGIVNDAKNIVAVEPSGQSEPTAPPKTTPSDCDDIQSVQSAARSQYSDVTAASYATAAPSATQSLPHSQECLATAAALRHEDLTKCEQKTARKSRSECAPSQVPCRYSVALNDACACATESKQTVKARGSTSRPMTDSVPSSPADASTASSYVTVMSTGDAEKSCLPTTTHQPDYSACRFPMPPTSSCCMPAKPARPACERNETGKKRQKSCELATLSCVDASHITELTGDTDESSLTTTHQPDDSQDTKHVAFAADGDDDDDDKSLKPVQRRPTTYVSDAPRDSSSDTDADDVGQTTVVDSTGPSSQPDAACQPQTHASSALNSDVSAAAEAMSTSLPADEPASEPTGQSQCSDVAAAEVTPSPAVAAAETSPGPDVGSIERKSVDISSHVSALLPSLPHDVIDDDTHTGNKCRPYTTEPTLTPTAAVTPPTTAAEQVPSARVSDADAKEDVEIAPLSADAAEDEDQENAHPDTLAVSLDKPPPPTKSNKDENEIENLEKQSDAALYCSMAAKVNDIDDKMSTLEPKRPLPEVVYTSMHEEKQTKDANRVADTENRDADVERKSVLANYGLQTDDKRKKSVIDRVIAAPAPAASASGIALTLSNYDNDDVDMTKKVGISSVDQTDKNQPTTRKTKVVPFSMSFSKTSTVAGKRKLTSVEKDKVAVSDEFRKSSISVNPKSGKAEPASKKRKSTFVEELMAETRRRLSSQAAVTSGETEEPEPEPVLPEPDHDATLIVALNRAAECEVDDYLHVASRPSSLSYRYIVSPNTQYAGGRSLSRTSTYQPVQCEQRHSAAGNEKEQQGTASLADAQTPIINSTKPTESSHTRLGSTARERLPASLNTDDNNAKTDEVPADQHMKRSVTLSPDAAKPSSFSPSFHRPTNQVISPVGEAAPTPVATHRGTPPVEQLIHVTLADLDRDDETVARKLSSPRSTMPYSSNVNNQTRVLPQLPQVSDPVDTNSPADVANTVQPSQQDVGRHQRNLPDHVISFTLDSYDSYDDRSLAYPVITSGGSTTSHSVKFNTGSHNANAETEAGHDNAHVSSVQPAMSSDCKLSIQTKRQMSLKLVTTEFRMSPRCETENVCDQNLMQVASTSATDASGLRTHDTASQFDHVSKPRTSEFAHSDSCNVAILMPTLPEKSEIGRPRNVIAAEDCSSTNSRGMSGRKTKSSKLCTFLAKLNRRKDKRKNN